MLCGLTLFDNIVCSFSHPMLCVTNTMLDENDRLARKMKMKMIVLQISLQMQFVMVTTFSAALNFVVL